MLGAWKDERFDYISYVNGKVTDRKKRKFKGKAPKKRVPGRREVARGCSPLV